MEDHGKPEGMGSRPAGQPPRLTPFQPFRIPYQASGSKRSKQSDLTPNPQRQKPSALARETVVSEKPILTSKPQSSNTPTLSTKPHSRPRPQAPGAEQSLNNPPPEHSAVRKWDPKEWKKNELESDNENMSLAVMMKLRHEITLLQEYLDTYKQFNVHLGHIASGPRHQGLLKNIFSTIKRLEVCTTHFEVVRQEKQRGNPRPCRMELAVKAISQRCKDRGQNTWDLMEEKIDMTDEGERAMWIGKKEKALKDVTEWMLKYLERLDRNDKAWKEREVAIMKEDWEDRWEDYGEMSIDDQKAAGWIMDVEK